MSAKAKESDGRRPVIEDITSLSNNDASSRHARLKKLPKELRFGDYDSDSNKEAMEEAPRVPPKLEDSVPGVSDEDYLGSKARNLDVTSLDQNVFEAGDAGSSNPTSRLTADSLSLTSTALEDKKALQPDGKGDSPAADSESSTPVDPAVKLLRTQLHKQLVINEELIGQLTNALSIIKAQNKKIESTADCLEEICGKMAAMTAKLNSDMPGDGKT